MIETKPTTIYDRLPLMDYDPDIVSGDGEIEQRAGHVIVGIIDHDPTTVGDDVCLARQPMRGDGQLCSWFGEGATSLVLVRVNRCEASQSPDSFGDTTSPQDSERPIPESVVEVVSSGEEHSTTSSITPLENGGSGQEGHTAEGNSGTSYSSISYLPPTLSGTGAESTEPYFGEAHEGSTTAKSDGDGDSMLTPRGVTVSTEGLDERDARLVPSEEQIEGLLPLHSWKDKRRARLIIEKLRNYGLGSELPQVKPSQIIKWSARRSWVILPTELKRVMLHSGDDSKPSILTAVGRSTNCPELGITVSPRGRRGLDIAISNGSEIVLIRKRRGLFTRLEVSSDKEPNLLEEAISILYDENWGIAAGVIRSEPLSGALGVS